MALYLYSSRTPSWRGKDNSAFTNTVDGLAQVKFHWEIFRASYCSVAFYKGEVYLGQQSGY
jgi:hypothetical protein